MQRLLEKVRMIQERQEYIKRWSGAMFYVCGVSASMIDGYIRKMKEVAKEDNLDRFPAIAKNIERMNQMAANLQERLWKDYSKDTMNVATYPWMNTYDKDYISLGRLFIVVGMRFAKDFKYDIALMENKATICSINQNKNISSQLVTLCILTASWSELMSKTCSMIMNNWRKVAWRDKAADGKAILYGNIGKSMHKIAENLARSTCELDSKKHLWWEQYHQHEDQLFGKLVGQLQNHGFNDMLLDQMTNDWLDYYIARSVMDAQQNEGKTPRVVKVEVAELARWGKKPMAQAYDKMLAEVSQALPPIEDPWEVTEYLEEHPYKVVNTLKELNISRVRST